MAGGRPPKPTRTKVIQHTFRKSRAKNEPEPEVLTVVPKPPSGLPRAGRKLWKRQAEELVRVGVLTVVDVEAFAVGCLHYGMAEDLFRGMTHYTDPETGKRRRRTVDQFVNESTVPEMVNGVLVQKPDIYARLAVVYAMRSLHQSSLKVFADFGLSPVARSRLDLGPTEKPDPSPVKRMMNDR